jgi:hypothetical protein
MQRTNTFTYANLKVETGSKQALWEKLKTQYLVISDPSQMIND